MALLAASKSPLSPTRLGLPRPSSRNALNLRALQPVQMTSIDSMLKIAPPRIWLRLNFQIGGRVMLAEGIVQEAASFYCWCHKCASRPTFLWRVSVKSTSWQNCTQFRTKQNWLHQLKVAFGARTGTPPAMWLIWFLHSHSSCLIQDRSRLEIFRLLLKSQWYASSTILLIVLYSPSCHIWSIVVELTPTRACSCFYSMRFASLITDNFPVFTKYRSRILLWHS